MGKNIDDLVRMNDLETLYDLMENSEDWMMQMDAAEGLVRLGDHSGLGFLHSSLQSDAREVREYASGILEDPVTRRKVEEMEARGETQIRGKSARRPPSCAEGAEGLHLQKPFPAAW